MTSDQGNNVDYGNYVQQDFDRSGPVGNLQNVAMDGSIGSSDYYGAWVRVGDGFAAHATDPAYGPQPSVQMPQPVHDRPAGDDLLLLY